MSQERQRDILMDIAEAALKAGDFPLHGLDQGGCLVMARSRRAGLASSSGPVGEIPLPATAGELARTLPDFAAGPDPFRPNAVSVALAAANSLLPIPDEAVDVKAQDLLLLLCRNRRVVVIGHFPFVEKIRDEFASFAVLELNPKPGDLPATEAASVLPQADGVLITATTLLNGTLAGLLELLRPGCFSILAGPSAPFAPGLFERGLDVIAGADVHDPELTAADVRAGLSFKALSGVRSIVWTRD